MEYINDINNFFEYDGIIEDDIINDEYEEYIEETGQEMKEIDIFGLYLEHLNHMTKSEWQNEFGGDMSEYLQTIAFTMMSVCEEAQSMYKDSANKRSVEGIKRDIGYAFSHFDKITDRYDVSSQAYVRYKYDKLIGFGGFEETCNIIANKSNLEFKEYETEDQIDYKKDIVSDFSPEKTNEISVSRRKIQYNSFENGVSGDPDYDFDEYDYE